jgi:hypothetical protein
MQNDREVRAREGHKELIYNTKYPKQRVIDEQPKKRPSMVAKGLFKLPKAPPPGLEPTDTIDITMAPVNPANNSFMCREGDKKGSTNLPRTKLPRNPAIMELVQEHRHPEKGSAQPKTTETIQNNISKGTESIVIAKNAHQHQDPTPKVIITRPEEHNEENETRSDKYPKPHALNECPTNETIERSIDSRPNNRTHSLDGCTPIVEPQTSSIDSQNRPKGVGHQHALSECDLPGSTPAKGYELSYVHDFADCPRTVVEYYKKGGKKAQPHDLADRAEESINSNAKSTSGFQQHLLDDCQADISKSSGKEDAKKSTPSQSTVDPTGGHHLEYCSGRRFSTPPAASTQLNLLDQIKPHELEHCFGDTASPATASPATSNNLSEHELANCPNEDAPVSKNPSLDSANGLSESRGNEPVEHRISSCPTPSTVTENRTSDSNQAMRKPTNGSTEAETVGQDAGKSNGVGGSPWRYPRQNRGRSSYECKENSFKKPGWVEGWVKEAETSRLAEHPTQLNGHGGLSKPDSKKEKEVGTGELLKANLYLGADDTFQSTMY